VGCDGDEKDLRKCAEAAIEAQPVLGRFVGQIGLPERSVNDCVYHESFSPQVILSPAARRHNGQVELLVCPSSGCKVAPSENLASRLKIV